MNLKVMVKRILVNIILVACISCFAQQGLNVYDAEGHLLTKMGSLSELNSKKCPSKRCFVAKNTGKKTNASAFIKKDYVKSKGKKRWYEVDWNQGVKLCPEKNFNTGNGTWIVNGSAHVDSKNCVYVDGSPYTRSILVLFSRNLNDLTDADSSWILVNQVVVELAGKKFSVRGDYRVEYQGYGTKKEEIERKEVVLSQDLIVDRTELRARDAFWLMEGKTHKDLYFKQDWENFYHTTDSLKIMDYPIDPKSYIYLFSEWRSEKDGLDHVFKTFSISEIDTAHVRFVETQIRHSVDVFDSTANGYRMPMRDEWKVLQLGGKSSTFLWGDEEDENELKKYMDINCASTNPGVYPVKQFAPNAFGLYDVYGNAEEYSMFYHKNNRDDQMDNRIGSGVALECFQYNKRSFGIGRSCMFMRKHVCRSSRSVKSIIPDWLNGIRLVRKLE
ncbi:MAG: SUMF1/EgtB/PvdO family nonheme iron enzyme [Fibrobacter sp.]|nr:SUMF1/EgtB/PvdO family nonheme iron enzyme [Fibrobacter sp.]